MIFSTKLYEQSNTAFLLNVFQCIIQDVEKMANKYIGDRIEYLKENTI